MQADGDISKEDRTLRPGQYLSIFKMPNGRTPRGSPSRETSRSPNIVCWYIRVYIPTYTIERRDERTQNMFCGIVLFCSAEHRTEQNTKTKFLTEHRTEQNSKKYLFFHPWFRLHGPDNTDRIIRYTEPLLQKLPKSWFVLIIGSIWRFSWVFQGKVLSRKSLFKLESIERSLKFFSQIEKFV